VTYAIAQILWVRYLLYAGYGCWAAVSEAGTEGFRSQNLALQLVRGTVLVVSNIVVVFSFSQLPLADVHAVIAIAPLLVTAASVVFLSETVGVRRWVAVGMGFVGILIILRPGFAVLDWVALSPLLGATLYAGYQVLTKLVSRHDRQGTTQFYTGLCGLVGFSVLAPFVWVTPSAPDWGWLGAAAFAGTLAHILIIKGLHLAPASTVQPFNYSMLVAAALLGYFVFAEVPDLLTVIGACIVVLSGLYALHRERVVSATA
nr:DMT family transporter [Gammaproteobacteria bacterium]